MGSSSVPEIIGKYKVLGPLGRGSMGLVYKAIDPEIGRSVAIKTMRRMTEQNIKLHGADTALERFRNEARSAGILRHPNIITIFEVSIQGDLPYIVMDFVEGESLYALIARNRRLAPPLVITYLAQIASAIDFAHSKGVLHRDLKPSNLMVDRADTVFVLDFGVASINRSYSDWETPLTRNPVVGTPGYMAPEQVLNESIDHRADLYSLAVVAFECFSGQRPFPGTDPQELMRLTVQGKPASLTSLVPGLPLSLEAEFERALSRQRFERYDSATQMVAAFGAALGIEIANAVPTNASGRVVLRESSAVLRPQPSAPQVPGPDSAEGTALVPVSHPMGSGGSRMVAIRPAPGTMGSSARDILPPMWDSPKSPSRGGAPSPRVSTGQSAGSMFRGPDSMSGIVAPNVARRSSILQKLTVLLAFACLFLSFAIIWYALQAPSPGGAGQEDRSTIGLLSSIIGASNQEATGGTALFESNSGALIDPPSDPVPQGKEISSMTDRELIGVLKSSAVPEILTIAALKEARIRRIALLVDAAVYPLRSDSYVVRVEAIKTLIELKDRRVVPQLLLRLDDHDPVVRGFAAKALGELGDGASVGYLRQRLVREDDPSVRRSVERAVERITGIVPVP